MLLHRLILLLLRFGDIYLNITEPNERGVKILILARIIRFVVYFLFLKWPKFHHHWINQPSDQINKADACVKIFS